MVARNLFTGYSIGGQESIMVSHLQFADDTLLMGVKSWANVRALRAVLVLFESMSGLKVNFNKSMLVGVNIPGSWLDEAASAMCCKVGKIPFLYLGLQIGGDPRRLVFWEPVLSRIKNRLSGWKSRFLSFGGRLDQTSDRWQWCPDPETSYTVRGAYQILTSQASVILHAAENLIWHPQVPLKVSIFAWRLLRDRLPTRANLVNRGVLSSSVDTCVFGCGVAESAHHLFFSCSFAGSLWDLVREWVDIPPVVSTTLRDHFVQFTASAGVSRARRSFMQLLWLVVEDDEFHVSFKLP
ncbi:uncharacterized protein LOC123891740 [Trifolium pratense]|uniref:uncharacterized protein LOC123891740 n=1 Tax=Trifolium pratense TaxID=57577 RepID=UPI001E696293|nr:uncharacterized protein LOC123891740 [Trifolium pratense]